MHNKAFLITQEIPRCQQHGHRDLIRFLLCVQLNPVEAKGESARLTAPKNLLPRHREGRRRVEGGPEDQAENVQDTLYHTHLPCGTSGCLHLPEARRRRRGRDHCSRLGENHTSGTSAGHCPIAQPACHGGRTAA